MTIRRTGHTSTYIPETDNVLITGGSGLSSIEIFFSSNKTFVQKGNMTEVRTQHTADRLSTNGILIAGGNTADLYDPIIFFINRTVNMNTIRSWHKSSIIDMGGNTKKVLLSGGTPSSSAAYMSTSDLYDTGTNTFTLNSMSIRRYYHTSTTLPNGNVIIAGGASTSSSADIVNSLEMYNSSSNSFMNSSVKMSSRCYYHTATYIPSIQSILFAGGYVGGNLNSYDLFNVTTLTFVRNGTMVYSRCVHTATLLHDGRVLLVGGDPYLSTVELFDPSTYMFTGAASLSIGRGYHTATLLENSGQILICGGSGSTGALNSCELYQP